MIKGEFVMGNQWSFRMFSKSSIWKGDDVGDKGYKHYPVLQRQPVSYFADGC